MYDLVIEEKGGEEGGEVLLIVNECVKNGVFVRKRGKWRSVEWMIE